MRNGLIVILTFLALSVYIGGLSVEYSVEFWVEYITHTAVDVPFLPCAIAGLFVASISIPIAILTWVLSFIL